MQDVGPLMTPTELADYLRVPVSAIKNWRRGQAGPPAVIVRGKLRFLRPAVDDWLRAGADEIDIPDAAQG